MEARPSVHSLYDACRVKVQSPLIRSQIVILRLYRLTIRGEHDEQKARSTQKRNEQIHARQGSGTGQME